MIWNAHITAARTEAEARSRLSEVGADEEGIKVMAPRMRHYSVKLKAVPGKIAARVKKEMLALGGEAALSYKVYSGEEAPTDMILMGTVERLNRLAKRLSGLGPDFSALARDLPRLIERFERERFQIPTPKGTLVLGERPLLMGILNVTPDSFYDGGKHLDKEKALAWARELIKQGADIIDVGGESTRPGAKPAPAEEEKKRVVPVIEALAKEWDGIISIDTRKAEVARAALRAGAAMINDVSALEDPEMPKVAAETKAALVLMHMKGTPETMQKDPRYDDLFGEIIGYLQERIDRAAAAGVDEEAIIVDPGIGFGKTVAHNLELVRDLWRLKSLGRPILLGHSNKSFIGAVLDVGPEDRFEGTAAVSVAGVLAGAHILRVHEVAGMKRFVDMACAVKQGPAYEKISAGK